MDSTEILKALRVKHSERSYMYVQNKYVFGEESDFLTFSYKDQTHEFEIKVSKSDFKADFKKEKHATIPKIISGITHETIHRHEYKNYCSFHNRCLTDITPNKFSFITPAGLIMPNEVPGYAGLYWVDEDGTITCEKNSKTIHKLPFSNWRYLANKLFYHGIKMRNKIEDLK